MGYFMNMRGQNFTILNRNKERALSLLKGYAKGKTGMAWVEPSDITAAETLVEAFDKCRYEADVNADGDIYYICFVGEKFGDDEEIFRAIAPAVESGSFIEMEGGDGLLWRWVFNDGVCREVYGRIVWE